MNLLKVLTISWLIGVGLSYFKDADMVYQFKCLLMSVIYFISAVFCYHYIHIELTYKRILNAYIISILCICMIVSSWFNFLFVWPEMYYLLVDVKQGDGLSWKLIYKSMEVIALLMVGKNGIINFYSWFICRRGWLNAIIANHTTHKTGRRP